MTSQPGQSADALGAKSEAIPWTDCPLVFVKKPVPACPSCGSADHKLLRVMPKESDGSRAHRRVCGVCSTRYLVVFEPEDLLP